jgi:hypothetical protein
MLVTVFSYPFGGSRLDDTILSLDDLVCALQSRYAINLGAEIRSGVEAMLPLAELVEEFLCSCSRTHGWLDIEWLFCLNWVVIQPTDQTISSAIGSMNSDCRDFLRPFLVKAMRCYKSLDPVESSLFVAMDGLRLRPPNEHLWGAAYGQWPSGVAVEMEGHRDLVFHEFLHLFGVSEGYDENTKPLSGCEDCWMQYDARQGNGLCAVHLGELRAFQSKGSTQQ